MAPPFTDEDPNLASVQDGMNVAEDEKRDAVADAYEAAARRSDDPEEALDDIDYRKGSEATSAPEIEALDDDPQANS